jgi:DNA-binding transcriptional LysR family regulator
MINFNQLRVFYHAAKYQNFTEASKKLCITQPAVTAQVKLFEDHCNLRLFKKKGRKIYLTDQGKTLYEYAKKIFDYEKEIDDVIEDMRELKRGILKLGTTKTYARYFMPYLISSFHETYPQIKIHLDEGSSLDMIHSLLDFRNEVAIIAKAEDNAEICFTPFSQEELLFLVAPGHRMALKKSVSFEELAQEPIIMKETGSGTRKLVNELFEKYGYTPNVLMETSNAEFIKQLVQRGDGVSFLVREAVATELMEKKLATVPLKEKIFLDVSIAYLKDQHLSPSAKAFLDTLHKLPSVDMAPQGIGWLMAKMQARRRRTTDS